MSAAAGWNSRVYAGLLAFYPEDLRRDHGDEMALVFADDLSAARFEDGLRGAIRVWLATAVEFLRLALPCWICTPAVRVPAISVVLFASMMLSMLPGASPRFSFVQIALTLPLLSAPFVALVSFWVCRRRHQTNPRFL
jgi:hypothetical protein